MKDAMQIVEEIIQTMNSKSRDASSYTFTIEKPVPIHCCFNRRSDIGGFNLSLSLVDGLGNPIHSQTDSFQYSNLQRYGQEATFYAWLPSSIKTLLDLHHKKLQAPAEV